MAARTTSISSLSRCFALLAVAGVAGFLTFVPTLSSATPLTGVQKVYLDWDHNIPRDYFVDTVQIPLPFPLGPISREYVAKKAGTEPLSSKRSNAAFKQAVQDRVSSIFSDAGGPNILQFVNGTGADVLTVRFTDESYTYDQPEPGPAITLLGEAYDTSSKWNLFRIDRFNVRPDGEIAIFVGGMGAIEVGQTVAHEIGHAAGFLHLVSPGCELMCAAASGKDAIEDKKLDAVKPPAINSNPKYHLRAFTGKASAASLASEGLVPGTWETGIVKSAALALVKLTAAVPRIFQMTAFSLDAGFYSSDGSDEFDAEGFGDVGVNSAFAPFDIRFLAEQQFYLLGKSDPAGYFDLLFGFGPISDPTFAFSDDLGFTPSGLIFRLDSSGQIVESVGTFNAELSFFNSAPPIPEPAALVILGIGLFLLIFTRRRSFD